MPDQEAKPPVVLRRVSEARGKDSAYAHCLGCGRHVGGADDRGFSASGSGEAVEKKCQAHTAETGHTTRMYGGQERVTEFFTYDRGADGHGRSDA
jgi:hypothetical protein